MCVYVCVCVSQPPPPKITHGDIFVSDRFVGWQEKVLGALQQAFDPATKVSACVCVCVFLCPYRLMLHVLCVCEGLHACSFY